MAQHFLWISGSRICPINKYRKNFYFEQDTPKTQQLVYLFDSFLFLLYSSPLYVSYISFF